MAVGKEIRVKINSIKNTQKITRAMEMVAASKMRKAQERMKASRPYSEKMRNVVSHLAHAHPEYKHPFLQDRDIKRVGFIIISSDRGLCGGLNSNLFKQTVRSMKEWHDKKIEIDLCTIGGKAAAFFSRLGGNLVAQTAHLGDTPEVAELIGVVKVMLDAFDEGKIVRLFLVYNDFVNTMVQTPSVDQLLPVQSEPQEEFKHHWDYMFAPEGKDVLPAFLTRVMSIHWFIRAW